jgi:hypothetical protein
MSSATATGGASPDNNGTDFGGSGGSGGDVTASSTATSNGSGDAASSTAALGGAGGGYFYRGGAGGDARASSTATSNGLGDATSSANATGGAGGSHGAYSGQGGDANATANSSALAGGSATATATAAVGTGGAGGGAANATSSATTTRGALAQAQSTAVGSSGEAQSTAKTSLAGVNVQSMAVAPTGGTATTNAIARAGGSGQAFANPGQTAYTFSTALPDRAYAATLIDGASRVGGALLGPRDVVFGTAILGANYAADGGGESHTYSASSTFDFAYPGDLLLGLIDGQQSGFTDGSGFQSMEFTIDANGVEILDTTFRSLTVAESFFHDDVLDLGSYSGSVDLAIGYDLVADGPGGFGFDLAIGAVPETSTWAMMLIGFAGLGFVGCRRSREIRRAV